MKIAVDFDGVISRELRFTRGLPEWLFMLISLFAPALPFIAVLRALARMHEVVIITARPEAYRLVTLLWLWLHRIPANLLIHVGRKTTKTDALALERPDLFIDDKRKHVNEAASVGIRAVHFTSWRAIAGRARELGIDCIDTLPFAHRVIATSRIGRLFKQILFRWVAQIPAAQREWQRLLDAQHLERVPAQMVRVNGEELALHVVRTPFTAYHVTTANTAQEIVHNGCIRPSQKHSGYADKARSAEVLFMYALPQQAQRFSLFSCWPYRLLVDFLTEEKTTILALSVPAGHRVGMTSWGELVAVEPIEHTWIELLAPRK